MADVFISYSRSDGAIAQRLAAALEARSISIWIDDRLTGGLTFHKAIEEELNKADKVIVLWSQTSVESGWVCDEAQAGRDQGKLVPLSIDGSIPPMGFRQIQIIDVIDWANEKSSELPGDVIEALELESAAPQAASQPVVRGKWPIVLAALGALVLVVSGGLYWVVAREEPVGAVRERGDVPVLVRKLTAVNSDEENAALASGITDELIVRLRRIDHLRIATALPDGTAPSAAFDSANVVEGSIQRAGDSLRVTMRLLDPNGAILWSQTFNRKVNELLQVQELTAVAIADALSVSLDVGANSTRFGGTDNPEAFASYMLGVANDFTPAARGYYERAVELDPDYQQALYSLVVDYGFALETARSKGEIADLEAKLEETADKAFNSIPRSMYSYEARGAEFLTNGALHRADLMYRQAAELDPGIDPIARTIRAYSELAMGRVEEAVRLARSVEQIDPAYHDFAPLAAIYEAAGQHKEVLSIFDKSAKSGGSDQVFAYAQVALAKFHLGRHQAAWDFARKFAPQLIEQRKSYQNYPEILDMPVNDLREWATKKFGYGGQSALTTLAEQAALDGKGEAALRLLAIARERPGADFYILIWQPAFADLRSTEGFKDIVRESGYGEAWRKSGEWGDYCRPVSDTDFECS